MQAIHEKQACKFGYKLWVAATPLRYAIQFYLYLRKDNFFDPDLRLGGSAVDKFMVSLPKKTQDLVVREKRERGRERERERGRKRGTGGEGEREGREREAETGREGEWEKTHH